MRDDLLFLQDFYGWLTESGANWPQTFFDWFGGAASVDRASQSPQSDLYDTQTFAPIRDQLTTRAGVNTDRLQHAYFQQAKPVDLFIETVESLWSDIADADNWERFNAHLAEMERARQAYAWDTP